jgi:hypothetical protein
MSLWAEGRRRHSLAKGGDSLPRLDGFSPRPRSTRTSIKETHEETGVNDS